MSWVVDVALAIVVVEAVVLARRWGARAAVAALGAGVLLMLAVRCALVGESGWAVVLVAASGPAHGWDVWRRLRRD